MKYLAIDSNTDKVICESQCQMELQEQMEFCFPEIKEWYSRRIIPCRGCQTDESHERSDHYGISTGYWCEECYNGSKYPYRKDAYDPYNEMGTQDEPDPEEKHWDNMATYNERFSGDDY